MYHRQTCCAYYKTYFDNWKKSDRYFSSVFILVAGANNNSNSTSSDLMCNKSYQWSFGTRGSMPGELCNPHGEYSCCGMFSCLFYIFSPSIFYFNQKYLNSFVIKVLQVSQLTMRIVAQSVMRLVVEAV